MKGREKGNACDKGIWTGTEKEIYLITILIIIIIIYIQEIVLKMMHFIIISKHFFNGTFIVREKKFL